MFYTRKHQIFDSLREAWYPKGEKIVPKGLVLNHRILTHWYLQDGNHNKQRNYYKFSTQSFSVDDVTRLSIQIENLIEIKPDVQIWEGKPVIIITKTNGESVLSNVLKKNALFKCFKYKL